MGDRKDLVGRDGFGPSKHWIGQDKNGKAHSDHQLHSQAENQNDRKQDNRVDHRPKRSAQREHRKQEHRRHNELDPRLSRARPRERRGRESGRHSKERDQQAVIQKDDRTVGVAPNHLAKNMLKVAVDPDIELRAKNDLNHHGKGINQSSKQQGPKHVALIPGRGQKPARQKKWQNQKCVLEHQRHGLADPHARLDVVGVLDRVAVGQRGRQRRQDEQHDKDPCQNTGRQNVQLVAIIARTDDQRRDCRDHIFAQEG